MLGLAMPSQMTTWLCKFELFQHAAPVGLKHAMELHTVSFLYVYILLCTYIDIKTYAYVHWMHIDLYIHRF